MFENVNQQPQTVLQGLVTGAEKLVNSMATPGGLATMVLGGPLASLGRVPSLLAGGAGLAAITPALAHSAAILSPGSGATAAQRAEATVLPASVALGFGYGLRGDGINEVAPETPRTLPNGPNGELIQREGQPLQTAASPKVDVSGPTAVTPAASKATGPVKPSGVAERSAQMPTEQGSASTHDAQFSPGDHDINQDQTDLTSSPENAKNNINDENTVRSTAHEGTPREDAGNPATAAAYLGRNQEVRPGHSGGPDEIDRQASQLTDWARSAGVVLPRQEFGQKLAQGAEHEVFVSPSGERVIKRTYPGTFGVTPDTKGAQTAATPQAYLKRLDLMNRVFGSDIRVAGVQMGQSPIIGKSGAHPAIVTSQPVARPADVDNPHPSEQEVASFMEGQGFQKKPNSYYGWERPADGVTVVDARPDNFIKTVKSVVPVDLVVNQKEPEQSSPAPVASEEPDFSPSGESDLTPSKSQQIIQQAINEKHAKAATTKVFRESRNQWNNDDIRRAESTFRSISQEPQQALSNAAHDPDFYQTQIARGLRAIARRHGTDVGFYRGTDDGPSGFYRTGRIWVRSNRPVPQLIRSFEHEMAHHRDDGPIVSALKKDVDLNSPVAQRLLAAYNAFLTRMGKAPLTEDRARAEVVAPFLAADTRYGDLSAAFKNPDAAVKFAQDYHVPGGSAESAGHKTRGLTFEPGDVGETGRERAPPPAMVQTTPVASKAPDLSLSGKSDLTPNKSQQIIQQAINEKHKKTATTKVFREDRNRWSHGDIQRAESAFRRISQERPEIYADTAYDPDFDQTQIAQRLRALAAPKSDIGGSSMSQPIRVTGSFNGNLGAARDRAYKTMPGQVNNKATDTPMRIGWQGTDKMLSQSVLQRSPSPIDHIDAVRVLPQLLENATPVDQRPAPKTTDPTGTTRQFQSHVVVNGRPYTTRIFVKEHMDPSGKRFYTLKSMQLENGTPGGQ